MSPVLVPIILPLATAVFGLIRGRPGLGRRWVFALTTAASLAWSIYMGTLVWNGDRLMVGMGGWAAPYGIMLVVDLLGVIMLSLASLITLCALLYGFAEMPTKQEHPLRLPLVQFLLFGMNLAFSTGDLFNLFVGFEVVLIGSYALLTLEADDWEIKQAFPYLAINLFGSTLFICAAGLAYALFGTLNFASISQLSQDMTGDPRLVALVLLLVMVFAVKAGLFPLYYWLPHSYPTLPIPMGALFAGMLTKLGVYVLLRTLGTVFPHNLHGVHTLIAWMAGVTIVLGVLGALSRSFIRGILSYHILSQVGFMLLALGLFTPLSFAAAIFYIVHHIVVKASLFLIGGAAGYRCGTDQLRNMGGLWQAAPFLGVLFLLQAFSLSGVPPLSGFWGKYLIVVVAIEQQHWVLVALCLIGSILTLLSMLKIWHAAFWEAKVERSLRVADRGTRARTAVIAGMTALSLAIGLGAEGAFQLAERAANQVLDQSGYARDVLGHQGKGSPEPAPAVQSN